MPTTPFKAYRQMFVNSIHPILSPHLNITVELPLKAIIRGFSLTTIPIT